MLDLAPETETTVRDYAARAGVSIDAFTRRLLSTYTQQQATTARWADLEAQTTKDFAASGETEDEVYAYGDQLVKQLRAADRAQDAQLAAVFAYINAPAEEIVRLHASDIARFDAELTAAASATPEEVAAADAEWEEHMQRMNAHRAITGEQPLYDDVSPAGT